MCCKEPNPRFQEVHLETVAGIDLHSSNSYVAIIDEDGKRIYKEKISNDIATITESLSPV